MKTILNGEVKADFLSEKNLEEILCKNKDLEGVIILFDGTHIIFEGNYKQLLIFQLIRNEIIKNYEKFEPIGSHKIKFEDMELAWNSEDNKTSIKIK